MTIGYRKSNIRKKFQGFDLGKIRDKTKEYLEVEKLSSDKAKGEIAGILKDKGLLKRKEEYRKLGLSYEQKKKLEKTITGGEKSLHKQKLEKERTEEKRQILAQQGKASAELIEAKENPIKEILTTASGEKIGHEALGIESKYKDARITALRPNSNQGQRASIRQEGPSPVSVAGGFGIVKKPLESKPNNVIKGNFGDKGSLQGKPPIGFRRAA